MFRRLCLAAAAAALLAGCGFVEDSIDYVLGGPTEDPANPGYTTSGEPIDSTTGAISRPSLAVPPMLRGDTTTPATTLP